MSTLYWFAIVAICAASLVTVGWYAPRIVHAWFARRAVGRARALTRAQRACAPLLDIARAKCAIARVRGAHYDVSKIYNCLRDMGAISHVRLRSAIADALVDEFAGDAFADTDVVMVTFAGRFDGMRAQIGLANGALSVCAV